MFELLISIELQNEWRAKNIHNETNLSLCRNVSIDQITVGNGTYGPLNILGFKQKEEALHIGSYCSIAKDVFFLLGGEHNYRLLSTYPFRNKFLGEVEAITKGPIIVADDVWIGFRATILSGVHIGQGAVIAAGSVIARDIPPYAIADSFRIIKYRFPKNVRKKLICFDYSSLSRQDFLEYEELFSSPMFAKTFFKSSLYLSHKRPPNY